MSNLLQLQAGAKAFGTRHLFEDAQFAINEGEHVGVIGPNGAGKTTLFKILAGEESLDSGLVVRSKSLQMGYLQQHDNWVASETVESYLERAARIPIWELKALGRDLGITEEFYNKTVTSLSGGYRMRCKLLYLIGQEPNLMLLDEPTNYLDLETTLVLEKFLQGYKGAFLLISHDREFLRRTTDHILEVESGEVTKYNGNIDDYFEQKSLLRTQLEARAMSLQEKKEEILKFVARFGAKASKAKQAQSRLKSLDRMETIELKSLPVGAAIKLPPPTRAGKVIASLEHAELGYGDKVVLHDVNFQLKNGDHLAVVGLNGAGKSTLLKAFAQVIAPLKGRYELGYNASVGYYAQHVAESLDSKLTVLEEMGAKAHGDVLPQDILDMAGSLLFSGADVNKKISVLSGGEKSRVALGQILLQKAPCLILDEPTNHLDFQTVEALTQALVAYEGTLVVVSHDRGFIRRVGTKILEVNHGRVESYPGTYDDYVWSLQKGSLAQRVTTQVSATNENSVSDSKASLSSGAQYRETRKNLERTLKQVDRDLSRVDESLNALNARLHVVNESLASPEMAGANNSSDLIQELARLQAEIDAKELEWLDLHDKKDRCTQELSTLLGV